MADVVAEIFLGSVLSEDMVKVEVLSNAFGGICDRDRVGARVQLYLRPLFVRQGWFEPTEDCDELSQLRLRLLFVTWEVRAIVIKEHPEAQNFYIQAIQIKKYNVWF